MGLIELWNVAWEIQDAVLDYIRTCGLMCFMAFALSSGTEECWWHVFIFARAQHVFLEQKTTFLSG